MDINPELRGFVDAEGRFKAWPAKQSKQNLMIDILANLFETGREYTAVEVNETLNAAHTFNDPAILRRSLIERKILDRSPDGRVYWKKSDSPSSDTDSGEPPK